MAEYINKWAVVDRLTALKNEFQQFKPFEGFEHAMYRKLCEVEMEIGKMPAAETVQRWIPVDERLPTEDDFKHLTNYECLVVERHYNLFDVSGYVDRAGHAYWTGDEFISGHSTFRIPLNVTHWMPLPEPPKEVE